MVEFKQVFLHVSDALKGKEFKRKGLRKQIALSLGVDFYDIEIFEFHSFRKKLELKGFDFTLRTDEYVKNGCRYVSIERID